MRDTDLYIRNGIVTDGKIYQLVCIVSQWGIIIRDYFIQQIILLVELDAPRILTQNKKKPKHWE